MRFACLRSYLALGGFFFTSSGVKKAVCGFPFRVLRRKMNKASLMEATECFGPFALTVATAVFTKIAWYIGSRVTHFTLPFISFAATVTLLMRSLVLTYMLFSRRVTADCTSVGAVATGYPHSSVGIAGDSDRE